MDMQDVTQCSPSEKALLAQWIREDNLDDVNAQVSLVTPKESFYTRYGKRALDILISLIALIVSAPINLVIACVTLLDVGHPILFQQQRTGKDEKPFVIYKFRNMTNARDANGELLPPSQRVTRWGKFVRRTSLDELLNFVSVLKGDMSIVGPRPLLNEYVERFNRRDRQRFAVRPGVECPSYRRLDHVMTWQERLENDVWYVQNCSLKVDVILLVRIVQAVFDRKSTAVRSKAGAGGFLGYDRAGSVITTQWLPDKYYQKLRAAQAEAPDEKIS